MSLRKKERLSTLFSQGEVICKEKGAPFEASVFQLPAPFVQRTEPKDIYHSFSAAGIVQRTVFRSSANFLIQKGKHWPN